MIEVEVKARAPPGIEEKIIDLGGAKIGEETHHDHYFNSPSHDFAKSDEALRIRIKEDGANLTFKGPKLDPDTKSRREVRVKIADPLAMETILESLGFSLAAVVKKRRTKYSLEEAVLCVDDVEGLGTFLEVELSGGADWQVQKRTALDIMARLGISESIRESYLELLAEGRDGR
ncbi:MAG: Adenylate cyclase [Methanothrix sp.]|jgi:adenylate cyclase class 2|nr:MAG: Adenylate cyclase [Methanothrix sp.]